MKIKTIFSWTFPIILVLNGYSSGIGVISLGVVILSFFYLISFILLLNNKIKVIKKDAFVVIFLFFCIFFIKGDFSLSSINKMMKILYFYYFIMISSILLDYSKMRKYIINFGIIFTSYLFIQVIFWKFLNIYLPNLFLLKPLYATYSAEAYKNYVLTMNYLRPASFFSEPAFYANYMLVAIYLEIFDKKYCRKKIIIFFSLGIIFSTSTAGIICLFLMYIYYFKNKIKKNIIMFLILGISFTFCLEKIEIENQTYKYTKNKILNIKNSTRIGKSFKKIDFDLKKLSFYIGEKNIDKNIGYTNSITDLYITYGLLGIIFQIGFILSIYIKQKEKKSKILLYIYILKCFSSGLMFNLYGILLFVGILVMEQKENKEECTEKLIDSV